MEKDRIKYLKDKKTEAFANANLQDAINKNTQNPFLAKFLAFKKTKKYIKQEDLL